MLAGVAASRGDVLDGAVAVTQLYAAVGALDHLCHVPLLGRQLRQGTGPFLEIQARQFASVLRFEPAGPVSEEALELLSLHEVHELSRQLTVAAGEVVLGRGREPIDVRRPARATMRLGGYLHQAPGLQGLDMT